MKKKLMVILLSLVMVISMMAMTACGGKKSTTSDDGTVLNIYAWNEEFKGFFEKYYEVPEGITVNWIINPSDGGVYQDKLDAALEANADAAAEDKVDMFLAEADYILKYVNSDYTADVNAIGVTDTSNSYQYTVDAATSTDGVLKGVSFQCCPSALIYRRSIAKDVLGTDDPAEVQEALGDWDKFNAVAKDAKDLGYYMTGSFASTYRVFSNNADAPWVDADNKLTMPKAIEDWIAQTEDFAANDYTIVDETGIWGDAHTAQMFKSGKTMCFFGPAWYFNFSMGNAQDPEKGCPGDWAICQGPQAHFWGGTWLLAAAGTDNASIVADIMNKFTNDEATCKNLIENEAQFTNNKAVNEAFANDPEYGNDFLGGQNDVAVFCGMTDNIKFQNATIYDQLLNEGLQAQLCDYFKGNITKEEGMANFYKYVAEKYPDIVLPE